MKNQKTISFDRHKAKHGDLLQLRNQGYRVICPLCKADIAFSENSGSWCSNNPNHYETHIYRDTGMRKKMKQRIKQESIANMKKKGYTEEQIRKHIAKHYPNVD